MPSIFQGEKRSCRCLISSRPKEWRTRGEAEADDVDDNYFEHRCTDFLLSKEKRIYWLMYILLKQNMRGRTFFRGIIWKIWSDRKGRQMKSIENYDGKPRDFSSRMVFCFRGENVEGHHHERLSVYGTSNRRLLENSMKRRVKSVTSRRHFPFVFIRVAPF